MKIPKFTYHLLFWLLAYLFWIYIFRNGTLVLTHAITIQFCYLVFIAANYYFNSGYTIPRLLNNRRYVAFGFCFIGGVLLGAILRVPVSYMVNKYLFGANVAGFNYLQVFFDSFINILFWVLFIAAGKMITERIRSQRYIEQIEREKADNELNFLRAQFNPHFLFNSINSIYAHIDKTNKPAREMLLVFSEMLRYQLYECNVAQIELDRELNYIRNYIALQKSRIDERIAVTLNDDGVNGNVMIAPLIFITFIENAFKYVGFNDGRENKITINMAVENNEVVFSIFNTKDNYLSMAQPERSSGLGIANTRRRLELLYPERHALNIDEQENSYAITLILKL